MAELKKKLRKLRKYRDGHRAFVQKTIEDAKELLSHVEEIDLKKVKLLCSTLESKRSELQSLDRDIFDFEDESKIEEEVSESCEFAKTIQECIVELESVLNAKRDEQVQSQSHVSPSSSASSSERVQSFAKLPKLELQKFNGNPLEWLPFWESFDSAVHKNSGLSNVDKFNYLKSLLVGPAQGVIAGLALTGPNYQQAIELLRKRF
jgi:hypothetical protein